MPTDASAVNQATFNEGTNKGAKVDLGLASTTPRLHSWFNMFHCIERTPNKWSHKIVTDTLYHRTTDGVDGQ